MFDLDVTDPNKYEDFAPMTLEDVYTEDDADQIPKNHQGYLEWYESIKPGDDAKWFNFLLEINTQIDEGNDMLSDQEDDTFDLDNMIQWLQDEYAIKLMHEGAHLNCPGKANTF